MDAIRKRSLPEEEEGDGDAMETDAVDTERTRPKNGHPFFFLTADGVVSGTSPPGMKVSWKTRYTERVFQQVVFITVFGAKMAVGLDDRTVLLFRQIDDLTPIVVPAPPALDIVI